MKKITVFLTIIIALATITSFEACQSAKSSTATKMLKFNLENGKGYDYEMTVSMDQGVMGKGMKMDMTAYYSMEVSGDDGTTKTINAKYERFRMKTAVAGINLDIDTDKPSTSFSLGAEEEDKNPVELIKKMFGAIKGQKFSMKVDAEGKITEVRGFENMAKTMADSMGLDEAGSADLIKQFEGQFNAEELKQSLERYWYIFPNKEVKVGDSWEKVTVIGGKTPAKYKSTYKVTEIEGDMVTLEETSKIEPREGEEISLTGDISGTIVVDSRSGLVVTADQDMNMKASAQGMNFDIKSKSRIKGKAR